MKKLLLLLPIFTILASCGSDNESTKQPIDPELKPYFDDFQKSAKEHGIDVVVTKEYGQVDSIGFYEDDTREICKDYTLPICPYEKIIKVTHNAISKQILINKYKFYGYQNEASRYQIFLHAAGHAFFNLKHTDDHMDIMYKYPEGTADPDFTQKLDNLFEEANENKENWYKLSDEINE